MKKILAAALALCLLCSVCAYAETAKVDETLYEGAYLTICEAFDMYLPIDWYDYTEVLAEEYSDDDMAVGAVIGNEDLTCTLVVSYITPEIIANEFGVESLEELGEQLVADDYTDVEIIEVNEIVMLTCVAAEKYADAKIVYVPDVNGGLYMLTFVPASDEEFAAMTDNMIASISPTEAE